MRISITLLILLLITASAQGQKTYKEIKTISKTFNLANGNKLVINGERTFISIETWNKNEISAVVDIIAKHDNQKQAKSDLEKIKIVFNEDDNDIYYSNAIQLVEANDKPKSNLRTELNLKVPEYAIIDIKNIFGELSIAGSISKVKLNTKFCTNNVNNFEGSIEVNSEYDKNILQNSTAEISFKGKRSDLNLNNLNAVLNAEMSYGNLDITYSEERVNYTIKTKHTPITILALDDDLGYHNISCQSCKIDTENYGNINSNTQSKKKQTVTIGTESLNQSRSIIESELEDIKIISINRETN
jgi:hypothetical protein